MTCHNCRQILSVSIINIRQQREDVQISFSKINIENRVSSEDVVDGGK